MGFQVLDEDDHLVAIVEMTSEYIVRANVDLDSEDFGSHTMNKFSLYKSLAKHLILS